MNVHELPALNASLNALSACFLSLGWLAIRAKNARKHRICMITALFVSAAFLYSYIYYHTHCAPTRYQGQGFLRSIYFLILITHVPLAALVVPVSCTAVWFAIKKDYRRHTMITKWLFPVWMYVSLTGVLIYLMLYVWKG